MGLRHHGIWIGLAGVALIGGCDALTGDVHKSPGGKQRQTQAAPAAPATPAAAPTSSGVPPWAPPTVDSGAAEAVAASQQLRAAQAGGAGAQPPPGAEVGRAEVGVGRRGQYEAQGYVTTVARAYFGARERIAFEIQIPNNMKNFQALHGRFPESHEEFMREIVEAGGITLPDLPPNSEYFYDPETAELMVARLPAGN